MTKPDPAHPDPDAARGVDLAARLDDHLLVERMRAGDPLAFEAIFRRYHRELCVLAESMVGSRAAAEDVVQDVFLAVWALRERWQVTASARAYLRRAVRNMAFRHLSTAAVRRRAPLPEVEPSRSVARDPALIDAAPSPYAHMEASAIAEDIARVAATFPPRMAEVYRMRRGEELSVAEIAQRLRLSPKTIEAHLTRALTLLRSALGKWRRD